MKGMGAQEEKETEYNEQKTTKDRQKSIFLKEVDVQNAGRSME